MFEQEAEGYLGKVHRYRDEYKELVQEEDVLDAFKDGAEHGYNKAMQEWKEHFLQCSSPFCLDKFSEVKCYGELGNMAKKEGEK